MQQIVVGEDPGIEEQVDRRPGGAGADPIRLECTGDVVRAVQMPRKAPVLIAARRAGQRSPSEKTWGVVLEKLAVKTEARLAA